MSKVTQSDIAKALNISPTTVGLVVGNTGPTLRKRLSEETVRRIQEKAEELGYLPNRAAQTMRSGRTNLILLLSMSGRSELGARCAYQIGRLVHEAGYEFQTMEAYWWPGDGKRFTEQVIALRPEGLIITGSLQTQLDFERIARAGIPMTSINFEFPGIPLIKHDVKQAIFELTTACLSSGRKRIALLLKGKQTMLWQAEERLKGYTEALLEAGWRAPEHFHRGETLPKSRHPSAMVLWDSLKQFSFDPFEPGTSVAEWFAGVPDAVICTNDNYAMGVMTYYLQNGAKIPRDVALSGFDNCSFSTQGITPLTTVEHPIEAMCEAAMEAITRRIAGAPANFEKQTFPCKVIWRQSMQKTSRTL